MNIDATWHKVREVVRRFSGKLRSRIWAVLCICGRLSAIPVLLFSAMGVAGLIIALLFKLGPTSLTWAAGWFGATVPSSEDARHILIGGVAAFGGSLVLATLHDLRASIPPLMDFMRQGVPRIESLAEAWWVAFVAFSGVFLGVVAVVLAKDAPPLSLLTVLPASSQPNSSKSVVFVGGSNVVVGEADDAFATFILQYNGEAQCAGLEPGTWTNVRPVQFRAYLERLVESLSECGRDGTSVVLEVRGFASSAEARNPRSCGAEGSDEANELIARARRDQTIKMLRELQPSDQIIDIIPGDVSAGRRFDDGQGNSYDRRRGFLNRRVEIRLVGVGSCHVRGVTMEPVRQAALVGVE
jgi:hypothetical protein